MEERLECVETGELLDFYEDMCVEVDDFIARDTAVPRRLARPGEALRDFAEACFAFAKANTRDTDLRCLPHVTVNPLNDTAMYIFKLDNNGTTFLVGRGVSKLTGGGA